MARTQLHRVDPGGEGHAWARVPYTLARERWVFTGVGDIRLLRSIESVASRRLYTSLLAMV